MITHANVVHLNQTFHPLTVKRPVYHRFYISEHLNIAFLSELDFDDHSYSRLEKEDFCLSREFSPVQSVTYDLDIIFGWGGNLTLKWKLPWTFDHKPKKVWSLLTSVSTTNIASYTQMLVKLVSTIVFLLSDLMIFRLGTGCCPSNFPLFSEKQLFYWIRYSLQ